MKVLVKCFGHLRSPWVFLQQAKRCLASLIPSYYEAVNRGEQEMPEYFNFASDVVDKWAQEEKDGKRAHNPAFWWVSSQDEEVKWSFKELAFLSRKAANVLTSPCGFQRGDKVMIVLPRIPEWWLLVLACMRTAKDISYRIQASKAKGIVVADQSVLAVDSITADCKLLKTKLVVTICANVQGMKIKPGSLGKASPPYDVQVVKAFIILSPAFLSHNPEALIQELQDHVKKSTAPYKYPRKASLSGEVAEENDGRRNN
ncbi:hypothetical protein Chor_015212 [Crotalus horridus]